MKRLFLLALAIAIVITAANAAYTGPKIRPDEINTSLPFSSILMDEDANITLDGGEIKNFQADGIVNVKAYGAVGDGSTDDTSAISAAQTAAEASSRKIYLPAGDYYAHGLNFSWGMYNGVIIGDGPRKTRMICNDSEDIFTISAPSITIQDIGFVGNSSRLGKGINIKSGGDNQRILHCVFTDLNYGIYARHDTDMVWDPHVVDCYAERCNYGITYHNAKPRFGIYCS